MSETMTVPVAEGRPPVVKRTRWWLVAVLCVAVLVIGAVAGWLARGPGHGTPAYVVAGGGAPTERQQQMIEMFDDYVAAWRSNDPDAVLSFYTDEGVFEWAGRSGPEYRVDDGTLRGYVENAVDHRGMTVGKPMLVQENRIATVGEVAGVRFVAVVEFTPNGELQVMRESLFFNR